MSGIVGFWNLDDRPLDASVLSGMSATLRHRGLDGEGRRVAGSIGFAHQRLWVTSEEVGEVQPLIGRSGTMLVMDGRLDNRDELLALLHRPRSVSDAACVLAAYEEWGEGFAERLNGDFAVAIYDERQQQILLARDSIGIRPLYYVRRNHLFAFASEIKALLAHPHVPTRPDDEGIADFLLTSSRPIDRQELTCFEGISALVPAHVAVVTAERTVTRRYWDFDTGHALRLGSFEEYAEAFRERFAEAVRRRVRSARRVVISVSGGLDSSSIFCQAETLRRAGRVVCPDVAGLSYVGAEGTEADERQYLAEIERRYAVRIDRIQAEPLLGVARDADEQIGATEAPQIDYMWGISQALHRRTTACGSRVLVTGHWGDQVLFSSAYLIDLLRHFEWGKIRRHLHEYVRWVGAAEARVLSRRFPVDVVRHHMPRSLVRPFKWVRRHLLGAERPRPWFSDAFLRRGLRFADLPATIGHGFHSAQARSIYFEARSKYHVHCMELHNKTGALSGIDVSFPFLDRDLLAFLMAIPGDIQNWNGVPRAIAREAMRGVLPEPVRTRASKADFSDLINRGVAQDLSVVTEALSTESLGVQWGYLDPYRLAPAIGRLSAGLSKADCVDSWDLADVFGLEVWLQVFLAGRAESVAAPPLHQQRRIN